MRTSINIIALGETAAHWEGKGHSIGVNDAGRWGHKLDYLIVVDAPGRFTEDRRQIITSYNPGTFLCTAKQWLKVFLPQDQVDVMQYSLKQNDLFVTNGIGIGRLRFAPWKGQLRNDRICHSRTSPFVAIYYAWFLGYKEIILWGVDFQTHKSWNPDKEGMKDEAKAYKELFDRLHDEGVTLKLGAPGSLLEKYLPLCQTSAQ